MNEVLETLFDQLLSDHGFDDDLIADNEFEDIMLSSLKSDGDLNSNECIEKPAQRDSMFKAQSVPITSSGGMTSGNTATEKLP